MNLTIEQESNCDCTCNVLITKTDGIVFDIEGSECWAANVLYIGDKAIAEYLDDANRSASHAESISHDYTDEDIYELLEKHGLTKKMESDVECNDHYSLKKVSLIEELATGKWHCFRQDGRFANEFTLYLTQSDDWDDIIPEDAIPLTPEEFAENYFRYPDEITESYVNVSVV